MIRWVLFNLLNVMHVAVWCVMLYLVKISSSQLKENQSQFVDQKLWYSTCHYKLISTLRTWLLFVKLLRKLKSLEWADRLNGLIVHQRISFSRFIDLYMKQIVHERMSAQNWFYKVLNAWKMAEGCIMGILLQQQLFVLKCIYSI